MARSALTFITVIFCLLCFSLNLVANEETPITEPIKIKTEGSCESHLMSAFLGISAKKGLKATGRLQRVFHWLTRTTKTLDKKFREKYPDTDEVSLEKLKHEYAKELQIKWDKFTNEGAMSIVRRSYLIGLYFGSYLGLPAAATLVANKINLPPEIIASVPIVTALLGHVFIVPLGEAFMKPLNVEVKKFSFKTWGKKRIFDNTQQRYNSIEYEEATYTDHAIASIYFQMQMAKSALLQGERDYAITIIADAAMRTFENRGGLDADNVTLTRAINTIFGEYFSEEEFDSIKNETKLYINAFYKKHEDKINIMKKRNKTERKVYIDLLLDNWLKPVFNPPKEEEET